LASTDEHGGTEGEKPPGTDPEGRLERLERRALHEVVHSWIPLAIVVVSICAALVGWRASLSDEYATHSEELSRQDLVHQQQQLILDNSEVDSEIRTFGQFVEYSTLATLLQKQVSQASGGLADQLKADGQADLTLAQYLGRQMPHVNYSFDPSNPQGNPYLNSDGTYAPGNPYDANASLVDAENFDSELHSVTPDQLHSKSVSQHNQGVDFTGIAALFVGVLVLLTFGAVVRGPAKLWFATSGAGLAVTGLILFLIVQLS
jgi:hypothetical protein